MNNQNRGSLLWVALGILVLVYALYPGGGQNAQSEKLSYSQLLQATDAGQIVRAEVSQDGVTGLLNSGERFTTDIIDPAYVMDRMAEKGVDVKFVKPSEGAHFLNSILSYLLPFVILGLVWVFFLKQMQSGGNKALGFGKSRAKLLTEQHGKVTFADVAGVDEAKLEVEEIVDFLKDPTKFQKLGGRIPKGVLLVGSPGTGKTLLARAIAGEAGVPFFSISGSDFVEMFVGVGASRVRDLFEQGKKNAPCIIFIDEIDAVGRHRGAGIGGGNDEREQTLNQLLVEMDGFETNDGVILIAATNRPDVLDSALRRPGRFDREVTVPLPDVAGREAIINVHVSKVPIAKDVKARVLARATPGFSGADLANLVNEAALIAARRNKRVVTSDDFEYARDKILMGPERRPMMKDEAKKLTAYHEGGHALVSMLTDGSDPIHKATIIPRGRALGLVMPLPEDDQVSKTRKQLIASLAIFMGGRAAEEIIFGKDDVTTGAQSDIQQATTFARAMVTRWGLTSELGPVAYEIDHQEHTFSNQTAYAIDEMVKSLVSDAYNYAKKTLEDNIQHLHVIAENLLEFETLTGKELQDLLEGKKIDRSEKVDSTLRPKSSTPSARGRRKGGADPKVGQDQAGDGDTAAHGADKADGEKSQPDAVSKEQQEDTQEANAEADDTQHGAKSKKKSVTTRKRTKKQDPPEASEDD